MSNAANLAVAGETAPPDSLITRIAQLTRLLRDSMRELGLDQAVKEAAQAIPDARDRLDYVAQMTEQAANRVLNAAEEAQPLNEQIRGQASDLDARWQAWVGHSVALDPTSELVADTRALLGDISQKTQTIQANLLEIIMAQDFQDLTGQVIMRMLGVISTIETELVQVLIDNVPQEKRDEANALLNGPQVNPTGKVDVVTSQSQVDDLLENLGF